MMGLQYLDVSIYQMLRGSGIVFVALMIAGALVQAVQFVFEERVMKMDVPVPPLLLIGMEGFWGVVVGAFVMYPIG